MSKGIKVGFIGTGKIMINDKSITPKNYSMTTPDPELLYKSLEQMIREGCLYVVMEVSSHALYLKKTFPLRFAVSIFTNLSSEHMELHKNMEDYYKTKIQLFEQSDSGIFNLDDEYSRRAKESLRIISFSVGINKQTDFYATEINDKFDMQTEYILNSPNQSYKINLKLKGRFNIYNSMMAIAAASMLGVHIEIAINAVNEIENIDGRMEYIEEDVSVIIDYAHTETAFENVLFLVNTSKKQGQNIITVFGCGGDRDRSKRPRMASIAEKYSDQVIITADNPRSETLDNIINDIKSGFSDEHKYTVIESREDAIENAILNANKGDLILLLGKGHERYTIVNKEYIPFDERSIIKRSLAKRREIKSGNKS